MTTSTESPSIRSASSASRAAGIPVVLAELTASGPVRSRIANATSWSGIRTATVPRVSPRSHCNEVCWRHTMVNGPGQKRSTRARAYAGTPTASASSVVAVLTSTGGGISRPRPLASRSAWTASASNASAATPYTVSVGSTTSSPRRTAVAAASMAASRSSSVVTPSRFTRVIVPVVPW